MKTIAALAFLFGSASAFAPSGLSPRVAVPFLSMANDMDKAFGVTVETGNKCPPLGRWLLEDAKPEALAWFQNAEIKHGRIAMLATVGFMTQKFGVHFPLYLGPTGSNAFHPESDTAWLLSSSTGVTFSDIAKAAPLEAIKVRKKIKSRSFASFLFVAVAVHYELKLSFCSSLHDVSVNRWFLLPVGCKFSLPPPHLNALPSTANTT